MSVTAGRAPALAPGSQGSAAAGTVPSPTTSRGADVTTETSTRAQGTATPDPTTTTAGLPSLLAELTRPDPRPAPAGTTPEALPADPRVLTLRSDVWELGVLPGTGGSLAFGRVRVDGQWLDLLRPARPTVWGNPEKCASFPLVPWSNRVRDGVLRFRGRTWTLAHNAADGTAIHGAVAYYTWRVVDRTASRVELELDTTDLVGVNFPWRFRSRLVYELVGAALRVTTTVENVDTEAFPAGFGHHPYFQRRLTPAATTAPVVAREELVDADAVTVDGGATLATAGVPAPALDAVLHVPYERGYALAAGMASGPAGEVPARADYRDPRPVGNAFVDDVLTDRRPGTPVTWTYPDHGVGVRLDVDDVYGHLVVYVPRRRAYFAVEPVTHVNAGVELFEDGVPGTGVFVLEPGEARSGSFTLTVERA